MVLAYSGGNTPRTKATDHSKVASTHKPSLKPSPMASSRTEIVKNAYDKAKDSNGKYDPTKIPGFSSGKGTK